MSHDSVSALRVRLHQCADRPATIVGREKPETALRTAWTYQSSADEIWILYEFANVSDRISWEASLSPKLTSYLSRSIIPRALLFAQWSNVQSPLAAHSH